MVCRLYVLVLFVSVWDGFSVRRHGMPSMRAGCVVISVGWFQCETAWYAVSTCWFCCYQCGMVAVMRRHGMPSLRVGFVVISVVDGCCYETAWYAVYACWFCWCLCGMVAAMRRHGCRLCRWLKSGDLFVMHGISNPSLYICCHILHDIVKFGFVPHNTVVETGLPGKFYVVGFCIHRYCSLE